MRLPRACRAMQVKRIRPVVPGVPTKRISHLLCGRQSRAVFRRWQETGKAQRQPNPFHAPRAGKKTFQPERSKADHKDESLHRRVFLAPGLGSVLFQSTPNDYSENRPPRKGDLKTANAILHNRLRRVKRCRKTLFALCSLATKRGPAPGGRKAPANRS